jgi:hypothetical protein
VPTLGFFIVAERQSPFFKGPTRRARKFNINTFENSAPHGTVTLPGVFAVEEKNGL